MLPELIHLAARDLVFLNGLLDVDLGLPFQVAELELDCVTLILALRDPTLIAVVDRQGHSHAQGP